MALGAGIFPQYPHPSQTQMNITNVKKRPGRLALEQDWQFEMNSEVYFYATMKEKSIPKSKHLEAMTVPARTMLWTTKSARSNKCIAIVSKYLPLDPINPQKGIEKFLKLVMLQS